MSQKRDRMAAAAANRACVAACTDADVFASAATSLCSKAGFWAVTTVLPATGYTQREVLAALRESERVPGALAKINPALLSSSVKVWWKQS